MCLQVKSNEDKKLDICHLAIDVHVHIQDESTDLHIPVWFLTMMKPSLIVV